jgi:hypothetical protein
MTKVIINNQNPLVPGSAHERRAEPCGSALDEKQIKPLDRPGGRTRRYQ